ncbi:MAG: biotin--[acetyl-CoA-carboxylase] ligase [Clostridia bacterium]|nr:biotin--[acetyl-CoA-carboxylase] ligase [Clostridia bacterium]
MKNEIYKYGKIEYYDTLPSTNAFLKSRAKDEKESLVVVASSQTKGHGRFDRKFYSPANTGIYMSILLKPKTIGFDATRITSAAAVAVAQTIETLSDKTAQIKWVNDVLIDSKKVCGILTEGSINPKNGTLEYAVLGIGINLFMPENGFESEIQNIAGYIFEEYDPSLKEKFIKEVLKNFFKYYNNNTEILNEYRKRSAVIGKDILVLKHNGTKFAKALLIDDNFRLKVKYPDNTEEFLNSGEISIKI